MAKAHIVHHIEGRRMRLRVPHKRHDRTFFRHLQQRLDGIEGVKAEVNPAAASVLLHYSGASHVLLDKLVDAGLDKMLDVELGPIGEIASEALPLPLKLVLTAGLVVFGFRFFD
jgi:hypothetical protein